MLSKFNFSLKLVKYAEFSKSKSFQQPLFSFFSFDLNSLKIFLSKSLSSLS